MMRDENIGAVVGADGGAVDAGGGAVVGAEEGVAVEEEEHHIRNPPKASTRPKTFYK